MKGFDGWREDARPPTPVPVATFLSGCLLASLVAGMLASLVIAVLARGAVVVCIWLGQSPLAEDDAYSAVIGSLVIVFLATAATVGREDRRR